MSSKQRSIKDHFKAVQSNELAEREPNIYPLFRSKMTEKKTTKKPKSCRPKATKILPPQNATSAASAANAKPAASAATKTRTKPTTIQVDLTSVTAATESIRMGIRPKQPVPSLNDMIAQDTHQFYLNQRKKREQAVNQLQQQQQQQLNQPIVCPQRLDMKEIEHQMNAYHTASWKQDRCCKVLYDQIPHIRQNSNKKIMWRDKYRPNTVEGLLGYAPDYKYLRDWLNQIKIKSPTVPEKSAAAATAKSKKKAKHAEQGKEIIYNLMLFVGDHGSGKTASIYTAAKETGYSIFEINSSSRRTGRDVTDSVGEMTESHLVRFSNNTNKRKAQGETIIIRDTVRTKKPKTIDIAEHFKKMLSVQNGINESNQPVEPVKPEASVQANPPQNTLEAFFNKAKSKQDMVLEQLANQPKQSLLLFEEVDILFEEDKGFWTAIIDLCHKSKRPIIMTCNDDSKIPFDFFNIQCTVYFEKATTEQDQASFVQYMQLICYAENYSIPKREITYLCELLEYDTRQVIDMLQFWLNETPTTGHFVYQHLFAHIMGLSNYLASKNRMQWMDHLKGCQSRVIEICTRYYDECAAVSGDEDQEQEVMRIEDLYQVMENAAFADAWVGLKKKHRHQLYDIDQYNAHQDGYHGNDTRVIYKDATNLDHWELGEIMDNSITVMNSATINKNNSWRNHLSAWSSHWEYLCNTRKLYSDDCLITCKHILLQQKEQRLDVILSDYMPAIRSLSNYDQGVAGKGRMARTRKRLRYLQLTDESRDALNWQPTLV